jgi:hypothetical protein
MFVIYNLLTQRDAQKTYDGLLEWFKEYPTRKVCHTDLGKVKRGFIKSDLLRFCCYGVKLKDKQKRAK